MPLTPVLTPVLGSALFMARNSSTTRGPKPSKPPKPYKDFPLFAHATGRWAKKIKGRFCYFGPWDDPDAALKLYLHQREDLYAGKTPRIDGDALTVRDIVNRFLTAKDRQVENGELKRRTFTDYHRCAGFLIDAFGANRAVADLRPEDFGRLRARLNTVHLSVINSDFPYDTGQK